MKQSIKGQALKFRAKKIGKTSIKMKYQREWETIPLETKIFKVYIREH